MSIFVFQFLFYQEMSWLYTPAIVQAFTPLSCDNALEYKLLFQSFLQILWNERESLTSCLLYRTCGAWRSRRIQNQHKTYYFDCIYYIQSICRGWK